ISRAFWSEIHVDPEAVPEAADLAQAAAPGAAKNMGATPGAGTPCPASLRADYRMAIRERRRRIEALLARLDAHAGARRDAFERELEEDVELSRYAAFRAAVELYGKTWQHWPARAQDGVLRAGVDYDGEAFRYHAYAQWLAREQLERAASQSAAGLYLDLPLGSHSGGYDTWRYRDRKSTRLNSSHVAISYA